MKVAQVVQAGAHAKLGRQPLEAVRDAARADGLATVGRPGEHVGVEWEGGSARQRRLDLARAVRPELHGSDLRRDVGFIRG
jgi:hypothetical protein